MQIKKTIMSEWFTTKVKYTKTLEDGKLKKISEPYLFDAVSFTDAESRVYEKLGESIKGEFDVRSITRTEIHDIFSYDDCGVWHLCKITFEGDEDEKGKTKKITQTFLVEAASVKSADTRLKECLEGMVIPYNIKSIALSPLVDIFAYDGDIVAEFDVEEGATL